MKPTSAPISIGVIGAGPGGLAFARAAQLSGHTVQVFERHSELTARGGSITLAQGAHCLREHLHLGDELENIGMDLTAFAVSFGSESESSVQQMSDPSRRVMRREVIGLLAASLKQGTISFNKELESMSAMDETSGPVTCMFKDGTSSSHDLVVGADGVHSRVRACLFDAPPPVFTGFRMFVLLDKGGHRQQAGVPPNRQLLRLAPGADGYLMEISTKCSDGLMAVQTAVVFKTDETASDAWDHAAAKHGFRQKLVPFVKGESDYLYDQLESAYAAWDWGVYEHAPLPSWSALGGRVCLLGDACHATAPFLGQGANMAFQDAVCLAQRLSDMTVPDATKSYEERRKPSCENIVKGSRAMAEAIIAAAESTEATASLISKGEAVREADLII